MKGKYPIYRLTAVIPLLLTISICYPQYDCENFPALSVSYIAPKTIAAGIDYFTEAGFTAGAGAAYTVPRHYTVTHGTITYDSAGNSSDLFAYLGYRIARIDYTASLFVNAGYTMGNQYKAQPFTSLKLLIPVNTKAISIEPAYIFGRGVTAKISAHLRL